MKKNLDPSTESVNLLTRLGLFPISTSLDPGPGGARLRIAGCDLEALAQEYGTPLYLYDRATLDGIAQSYLDALARFYPGEAGVTYAGKAFLCTAIAQWTQLHGLKLDCTGAGELRIAAQANVPREQVVSHGVNKSSLDLQAALDGAEVVVVDNLTELERLAALCRGRIDPIPDIWLRLRPGVAVHTHSYNQTGQDDSKFGMSAEEAAQAVHLCLEQGLALTGLHFHLGSLFHDPAPYGSALEVALDLAARLHDQIGWWPQVLCTGGGWGVAYTEADLPYPPVEPYIQAVCQRIVQGCQERGLPLPRLQLEPGRSLVARAGVALYQVGATKRTKNRTWLLLDGGLADNPRPALYHARYTALPAVAPDRPSHGPAWLAGPFCESGDVLIETLPMPELQPGEIIAVPVSGAYQISMGSNYNGARRPAVVLLDSGSARLIQRRETLDDLVRRDLPLFQS